MTADSPESRDANVSPDRLRQRRRIERLSYDYESLFPMEVVASTFDDSYRRLAASASITTFLPALAERLTRERLTALAQALHIRTGGSDPGARIHPEVVAAMKDVGLSLDEEFPKPLTDEVVAAADVVITMGCGDECPYVPGRRYEDWPIADPGGATPTQVTAIRDDIDARVRRLLSSLLHDLSVDS